MGECLRCCNKPSETRQRYVGLGAAVLLCMVGHTKHGVMLNPILQNRVQVKNPMTMTEKILANHSDNKLVSLACYVHVTLCYISCY